MNLIRAEVLKLRTTRLILWLALFIFGLLALIVSVNASPARSAFELSQAQNQRDLLTTAAVSTVVALILGIVASTAEYAHGTVTQTFLVAPIRERVVAAKLAAAMVVGIALAAFAGVVALGLTAVWLSARSIPSQLGSWDTLAPLGGVLVASALAAAIGVGFGALVRRQTAAIVVALVWLFVGEQLIQISGKQRYAPGRAIASVVEAGHQGGDLLRFWPGLLLAVVYAVVLGVLGAVATARSDVT